MGKAASFDGIWAKATVRLPDGPADCDTGVTADPAQAMAQLRARWTIEGSWPAIRCDWSAITGMEISGCPVGSFLRGAARMWEKQLAAAPSGVPLLFGETLRSNEASPWGRPSK